MPDELSRSGVLEETQHVFNAALILRRAIQSLQPITPFPAEPADLSEEKIDVHVPMTLDDENEDILVQIQEEQRQFPRRFARRLHQVGKGDKG